MATRKSSRLTEKVGTEQIAGSSKPAQTGPLPQGSRTPSKRQKTSNEEVVDENGATASKRKRKGKESVFMKELPLDVVLEIFGLLEPIDLLHLSRVSKSLHDLLTSSDVTFLWKLAYKNLKVNQPPPCPAETNIVCYTNFLYGHNCQICGSTNARGYHDTAFIRLCTNCASESLLCLNRLDPVVASLCNQSTTHGGRLQVLKIVKEEYNLRLKEFLEAKKAQEEIIYVNYVNEHRTLCSHRKKLGWAIRQWRESVRTARLQELVVIRTQREAGIRARLEMEGYSADFDKFQYRLHRVPHVRKPNFLSDSEWSFIRADILDFFQAIRDDKSVSDTRHNLRRRIYYLEVFLSSWRISPNAWWIVSADERIASFVKNDNPQKAGDFELIKPKILEAIASWRAETDDYLASLIPQPSVKGKGKKKASNIADLLNLATTFFKCHWCTEPISYPRVLMHSCFAEDPQADDDDDDTEEEVVIHRRRTARQPLPPKQITYDTVLPTLLDRHNVGMCAGMEGVTYDDEASKAVREIVVLCGKDPNTVTYAAMEELDARIECLRCSRRVKRGKNKRLIMKWTMALVHVLSEHYDEPVSSDPAWSKIDHPEELERIRRAEVHLKTLKRHQHVGFFCNHCSFIVSFNQQLPHIQDHKIAVNASTVHTHFTPPMDVSISVLSPAVNI